MPTKSAAMMIDRKRLLLCLFISLLSSVFVRAQETIPIAERDVVFFYTEFGLPNEAEPKILVISSHIYRLAKASRYVSSPASGFRTALNNAFWEKMETIRRNEYNSNSDLYPNQITTKSYVKQEWAYYHGKGSAEGTGPELYQSVSSATTFLVNVRDAVIDKYVNNGYSIFQVDFDEYIDEDTHDSFTIEKIEKLSPLRIAPYHIGSLRNIARPYQEGNKKSQRDETKKSSDNTSTSPCTQDYMIQSILRLKGSYRAYVNNELGMRKPEERKRLLGEAYNILALCPYNADVKQIYDHLNAEIAAEQQMLVDAFEAMSKYEIEGTFSPLMNEIAPSLNENNSLSYLSGAIKMGWGISFIRFMAEGGLSWMKLPDYIIDYDDKGNLQNLHSDYPKDGSLISLGTLVNMHLGAGLQGEIPLDWNNRPYNHLNLFWEGGGQMIFTGNPSGSSSYNFYQQTARDFVPNPLFGIKGSAGLEIYFSDTFGIGLFGGIQYLYYNKDVNASLNSDSNGAIYSFSARPISTKNYIYYTGIKLIFGRY